MPRRRLICHCTEVCAAREVRNWDLDSIYARKGSRCGMEEEEEEDVVAVLLLATRRASKSCKKKFQTNTVKDRMLNHIHQSRAIFFSDISDNCAEHGTGIRSEIVLRIIPQESLHNQRRYR